VGLQINYDVIKLQEY